MKTHTRRGRGWALVVAMLLSGGTLFGTCQMRVRDAVVDGSKSFFFDLLGGFAPTTSDLTP